MEEHMGDTGVDGRVILKWILKKLRGCGLYRGQWLALVNTNESAGSVKVGNFLTS
jgi:hypothetical protein